MNMVDGGGETVSSMTLSNCEVYACGAFMWMNTSSDSPVITFRNNLFHRGADFEIVTPAQLTTYNNLFFGSSESLTTVQLAYYGDAGSATNKNNAFDNCDVTMNGVYSNNAYLNGSYLEMTPESNSITTNLTWIPGPLGYFYQVTNSPLLNMGNTNANLLGLYHYTTQTNEVPQADSIVDIGYHYVALGTNGLPIDTDGSGVPDYLKDANGNGVLDSGEISWTNANDLGLTVVITQPANNSVIP
jgi:hypothetical protein